MSDSDVSWLVDIEHLRRMPQRYARAVDDRDGTALAALFHPDGVVHGTRGTQPVPEYLTTMAAPSPFGVGQHVLADPIIDLEPGADRAHSDTYAVVYQAQPTDGSDTTMTLGMRYVDELVRTADGWQISKRRATLLWRR